MQSVGTRSANLVFLSLRSVTHSSLTNLSLIHRPLTWDTWWPGTYRADFVQTQNFLLSRNTNLPWCFKSDLFCQTRLMM